MWIAANPRQHEGRVLNTGHCMRHVQLVADVPHSSKLRRGARVVDMQNPPRGLVIATFDHNGRYANKTDGSSHIAILLAQQPDGLMVMDQWVGKPVSMRLIRHRHGTGNAANDADRFYVAESDEPAATTSTA
jgi:hypothetical protein